MLFKFNEIVEFITRLLSKLLRIIKNPKDNKNNKNVIRYLLNGLKRRILKLGLINLKNINERISNKNELINKSPVEGKNWDVA